MKTKVWAHRGASGYMPENTLPSFKKAVELGADGVELDIQLSKDGEIVVCHDEEVDRTSNTKGWLKDYTLAELKAMDFSYQFKELGKVSIPTMKEVFELLKPTNLIINIELKTGIFDYESIEEKIIALTHAEGFEDRVIYSSFNHHSIAKLKEIDSTAETAWLFSDVILDVEKYAKQNGVEGLHPAVYHMYMSDFMKRWNESGEKVRVWTVNNEKDMKNFIQHDLEAVITNYPDVALRVRREVTGC